MKRILFITIVISFVSSYLLNGQETVTDNDIYIENDLIYRFSNDSLFTGKYERKRKNGHLVYDEDFEKGIIKSAKYYYNGKRKIVSDSVIYNPIKPFEYKEIYRFNLKSKLYEKESFDDNGKFILKEEFEDGKLTYSCQYNGKKKHGKEFCYSKDGDPLEFEYKDGKKIN